MLDRINLRKLTNGYTIKYHFQTMEGTADVSGTTLEVYVKDKKDLAEFVAEIIKQHIYE